MRGNGKVERSHRIDGEEFYRQLKGVVIDDTQLVNDKLAEGQDFYHYPRPHGALGGQTPTNASARRPPQQRPPSKRSTSVLHSADANT
jgi:transposase InsO family protein